MSASRQLGSRELKMIAQIHEDNPGWKAKEVLGALHKTIGRSDWPKLSIVQVKIKQIEDKKKVEQQELKEKRQDWTIGTLPKHNVSPDSIPAIMAIIQMLNKEFPDLYDGQHAITIEQAQWVSRLHYLIPDIKQLFVVSLAYWLNHNVSNMVSVAPDTYEMDEAVRRGDFDYFRRWFKADSPMLKLFESGVK
jgi:hypothetical protein